ncbi:MAG TPA: hypothetical protein VFQ75_08715 [Candidatus Limnocylindrales bacterium]|nr:hypothetical protein [Candidatus Limnocylindrales bacterium]
MTDEERDPESAAGAEGTTDQPAEEAATEVVESPVAADEPAADEQADETDEAEPLDEADEDEAEDEDEEDELEDEAAAPVGAAAAAGAAAATGARRTPRGTPPRKATAAPTVSEQAVRVDDRASAIFVVGVVGVFVAIFVLALLFGYGSLFGNVFKGATPVPTIEVTAAPSGSAAASPSASASAAPSVSVAPSASPAASPSAEPSPSPSAS